MNNRNVVWAAQKGIWVVDPSKPEESMPTSVASWYIQMYAGLCITLWRWISLLCQLQRRFFWVDDSLLYERKVGGLTTLQELRNATSNRKNVVVDTLRTDDGDEYTSKELKTWWMDQMGISHEISAPYTPQQSGVAEHYNRTLL